MWHCPISLKPDHSSRGVAKTGAFRAGVRCRPSGHTWLEQKCPMEFSYERQSTRLGPSTWRRIAMSTLRTADDVFWSAICKEGWKPVKMRLKSSRVISTGFRRTNGEADRAADRANNSAKRETGLHVARHFVHDFGNADLGATIHRWLSLRSQVGGVRIGGEQGVSGIVS